MLEFIITALFVVLITTVGFFVFSSRKTLIITEQIQDGVHLKNKKKQPENKTSKTSLIHKEKTSTNEIKLPWVYNVFKGHTDQLIDYTISSDGKTLLSCSKDQFVLIWNFEEIVQHSTPLRLNLGLDYCDEIRFSPDGRAFIIHLHNENILRVYAYSKKQSPKSYKFINLPKLSNSQLKGFEIGGTIFILSYYKDCTLRLTNFKGLELYKFNTNQMSLEDCKISPCGRTFATLGSTKGLKLWKPLIYPPEHIEKINELCTLCEKHTIEAFCFSFDASKIALICSDGAWKIFNYLELSSGKIKPDPNLAYEGIVLIDSLSPKSDISASKTSASSKDRHRAKQAKYLGVEIDEMEEAAKPKWLIALSENGHLLAIAHISPGNGQLTLSVISTLTGKVYDQITSVSDMGSIFKLSFEEMDRFIVLGDSAERRIYVLRNVSALRCQLEQIEGQIRSYGPKALQAEELEFKKTQLENELKKILCK